MSETPKPKSMIAEYRGFIRFTPLNPENRKTQIWEVVNRTTGIHLGHIRFFPAWRRYSFEPRSSTVFDQQCLRDIADFLQDNKDVRI